MTTLTSLIGTPVTDGQGNLRGRVADLAVGTGEEAGRVMGLILKGRGGRSLVSATEVRQTPSGALELRPEASPRVLAGDENYILLRYDLLDQQIIDVHGRKVVRVNDVDLQWFSPESGGSVPHGQSVASVTDSGSWDLRVREVEVGMRGAIRRLFQSIMPRTTIDSLARRFSARVIPWDFVDMIEVDPARRVKLKIEHERLAQLHPSDIADILEDLAPAEREAILTTLDEEVAAEALEEVDPKLQVSMVESLDSETAAAIVEEMDPSAAADLLAELPEARSEAILEEMNPEERQEVEELLEFRENSAAGRMTTEYVSVPATASVADAIRALRDFDGYVETITEVYLVDEEEILKGVVPLARILLAVPETRLEVLTELHYHACAADAHENKVAELFDRYNLRALPVIDAKGRLVGAVEADHVIAFLRADGR
ncbi:magnesium transporter MgtE N-terminal domain-containing protein [Silvibacterium sp.]|uniref:magnesium transporter MgtE N-terminal domain-containing protein n=1 Tax=Silvibacterium sp. TaxID=1964179 RepID=UPI0039E411CF